MSANLSDVIQEKIKNLAKAAPKAKFVIVYDGEMSEKVEAVLAYAQELGLELSVEKREALEKTEKAFAASFQIVTIEEMTEWFERRIVQKPIVMESSKQFLDKGKSMHREHMKQMRRYQNKHWKR